jgi:acetyl-CoA synthetase (ADP-forming)
MNETAQTVINQIRQKGRKTLSEFESKQILAAYGIPVTREMLVEKQSDLMRAVEAIQFPLVLKGCSAEIAHKSEKNLVRLDIRSNEEASRAFAEISAAMDGSGAVLVQEMINGSRELVMGLSRDEQFGPCVMFGLGGIFTEILGDVVFRKAPLEKADALEMLMGIKARKILGPIRGLPVADTDKLASMLMTLGRIGLEIPAIREIDLNPVILAGEKPIAVDALITLD